jgi:integrase
MGHSRPRTGTDGKTRYTAYYVDIKGKEKSAGTFSNRKESDKAWQRAEVKVSEGRVGDPARGRQPFRAYVLDSWLPNHHVEASTLQSYTYSIHKHLIPEFGDMKMAEILPEHVRAWIVKLKGSGMKPVTIRYNKILLSAIFTTALDDQVTFIHPVRGVRTPHVPRKPLQILTPEQFDDVWRALPDPMHRLLVETEIESGLRWGELTELRVKDLNRSSRILTVSRAVVEVNPKFHPTGGRFLVKDYPKDKEYRRLKLSPQIVAKLDDHIQANSLTAADLLFRMSEQTQPRVRRRPEDLPDPDTLGMTTPNAKGHTYKHGTLSPGFRS